MNDEQLYLEAIQEVDNGTQDPALWAKAMTLAEGDEEKARYRYITLRVQQRSITPENTPPVEPSASPSSKTSEKRIPEGWVPLKGDNAHVIERMIRIGKEIGIVVDRKGYVPPDVVQDFQGTVFCGNSNQMHWHIWHLRKAIRATTAPMRLRGIKQLRQRNPPHQVRMRSRRASRGG